MAEKLLRKGQRVYAADGTFLGRLLQCDARFMVIGNSRWKPDHWIVPNEEVAAAATDVVVLRSVPAELLPETSEPWWPAADHLGNADGIDLEPLRAGMAEVEDKCCGTDRPRRGAAHPEDGHREPLPSAEDARGLDRERRARLDARTEKLLSAEVEDVEIGAASEAPPVLGPLTLHANAFDVEPLDPVPTHADASVRKIVLAHVAPPERGPSPAPLSAIGEEAARTARRLERLLRAAGLSVAEAHAVAQGGYAGLAALHAPAPRRGRR